MGYTHYWYRPKNLKAETFKKFASDCMKIFDYCENELGIKLADSGGNNGTRPEATEAGIFFNGSEEQPIGIWTTTEDISIPWPSPKASLTEEVADPSANKTSGNWFAGTLVSQRVAPINSKSGFGSGTYESVCIERLYKPEEYEIERAKEQSGLYFSFCKTAYRPYDLTVTAVLIALKHYFPKVKIHSDGEDKDWLDGKFLCNNLLGYGLEFNIDNEE